LYTAPRPRPRPHPRPRPLRLALPALAFTLFSAAPEPAASDELAPHTAVAGVVILSPEVRDSMAVIFARGNEHWNDLADESTLAQMLGTGRPTQLEYLGCLRGHAAGDTVWVDATVPAARMRRFQFAVTGSCDHVAGLVGTWHTHPYRASPTGKAIKERALSATDLKTFAKGADRALLAVWDADSVDAAVRVVNGAVRHPATTVVRERDLP